MKVGAQGQTRGRCYFYLQQCLQQSQKTGGRRRDEGFCMKIGQGIATCLEPREKSCSVEMTVKCTGPKSKLYQGESAKGSFAGPGMMNLTYTVAVPVEHETLGYRPTPTEGIPPWGKPERTNSNLDKPRTKHHLCCPNCRSRRAIEQSNIQCKLSHVCGNRKRNEQRGDCCCRAMGAMHGEGFQKYKSWVT